MAIRLIGTTAHKCWLHDENVIKEVNKIKDVNEIKFQEILH